MNTTRRTTVLLGGALALLAGVGGFLIGRYAGDERAQALSPLTDGTGPFFDSRLDIVGPPDGIARRSGVPFKVNVKNTGNARAGDDGTPVSDEAALAAELEQLKAELDEAKTELEFWKRDALRRGKAAEERYPAFLEYVGAPDSPDLRSAYELIEDTLGVPWKDMSSGDIAAVAGDVGPFYRDYQGASSEWQRLAADSRRPPDDPEALELQARAAEKRRDVEERLIARFGEDSPYIKRLERE